MTVISQWNLYETEDGVESFSATCGACADGSVALAEHMQGHWTEWCFDAPARHVRTVIAASEVPAVLRWLAVDEVDQIPAALALRFTGLECIQHIRTALTNFGIEHSVAVELG